MQDWQRRVIAEREDLNTKVEALVAMIRQPKFKQIVPDAKDRRLLRLQHNTMSIYLYILSERISRF